MKIIQFIDSMYTGGAETSVCNAAIEMKNQGADVTVVCFSTRRFTGNEARLDEAGVKTMYLGDECLERLHLKRLKRTKIRYVAMLLLLVHVFRQRVIKESPDVIHFHLDALLFYPFIPKKNRDKISCFWTIHSEPDVYLGRGLLSSIRRRIIKKNPDICMIAINEIGKKKIAGYAFSNAVEVIPNGISMERYARTDKACGRKRKELNIPADSFVVGNIGRFGDGEKIKNQLFLVDIFDRILDIRAESTLILIGGGSPSDALKTRISNAGSCQKIILLTERADIPDLLGIMDVFVMPSKFEGFPMTLIEAQAAGIRCVVSDAVTTETALTDRVCYLPLDAGKEAWMSAIMDEDFRSSAVGSLHDYDIANTVKYTMKLYGEHIKGKQVSV